MWRRRQAWTAAILLLLLSAPALWACDGGVGQDACCPAMMERSDTSATCHAETTSAVDCCEVAPAERPLAALLDASAATPATLAATALPAGAERPASVADTRCGAPPSWSRAERLKRLVALLL